tara:strand:+ start:961 stop:1161 length:201 start_codon:yes stop_codon:yes gene_type:complete
MLDHNSIGTVIVKNSENGALAEAILTARTKRALDVLLNGIPITFDRKNQNRYVATFANLKFELVSG